MRGFRLALAILAFSILASQVGAQYWFQFGAKAGSGANFNNGASIQIQTITPQMLKTGSLGYWVGEDLPNGAFLQVGYVVENETGSYSTPCSIAGCTGYEYIKAGDAEWFYEYFPANNSDSFLGAIGPDGSAGVNGTFHTYSFYSNGNVWYFVIDGRQVGSVNLGVASAGPEVPVAFGELANTSDANTSLRPVTLANLSVYKSGSYLPVSIGTAYIGYGATSPKTLPDPYGVREVGNRTDYFQIGSGLPQLQNGTQLWALGYYVRVNSQYGEINGTTEYLAYTGARLYAPPIYPISANERAIFTGWTGAGRNSYTGPLDNVTTLLFNNISETANWQIQYLVNVTSKYGITQGSGWYNSSSIATLSLSPPQGIGAAFYSWSNGNANATFKTKVNSPINISALFRYSVTIIGKDSKGNPLQATAYAINGVRTNSTPLLFGGRYEVTSATYSGVLMNVSQALNVTGPQIAYVQLPVYPVTIKSTDPFGIPVNASGTIAFANGTVSRISTGSTGTIVINDVPYGYAKAQLQYLGMQQTVTANAGVAQAATFASLYDIGGTAIIVALGGAAYLLGRKREMQPSGRVRR